MPVDKGLHHQIEAIRSRLLEMAGIVETMIEKAKEALVERSTDSVDEILALDGDVDRLEMEVDEACYAAVALGQPTAVDMRFLVAVMKITADLERMGDSAVNIAQSVDRLADEPPLKPYVDLPRMFELTRGMVRDVLDAFVRRDAALAQEVCRSDDDVDNLYGKVFGDLLALMREDSAAADRGVQLLLIARNLERIADHATNIGEDVVFYVEGKDIRHGGPEGEAG